MDEFTELSLKGMLAGMAASRSVASIPEAEDAGSPLTQFL
jgi:hypothetical protein